MVGFCCADDGTECGVGSSPHSQRDPLVTLRKIALGRSDVRTRRWCTARGGWGRTPKRRARFAAMRLRSSPSGSPIGTAAMMRSSRPPDRHDIRPASCLSMCLADDRSRSRSSRRLNATLKAVIGTDRVTYITQQRRQATPAIASVATWLPSMSDTRDRPPEWHQQRLHGLPRPGRDVQRRQCADKYPFPPSPPRHPRRGFVGSRRRRWPSPIADRRSRCQQRLTRTGHMLLTAHSKIEREQLAH